MERSMLAFKPRPCDTRMANSFQESPSPVPPIALEEIVNDEAYVEDQ